MQPFNHSVPNGVIKSWILIGKAYEIVLRDCWLAGDEEIKTDDTLFISASAKLADLIEVKEAELEKL